MEEAKPEISAQPKKKKLWIAAILAAFAVALVLIIYFAVFDPATSLLSSMRDNDGDGIVDSQDFYDNGNGKIRIYITHYREDGTADMASESDPFFQITIYYKSGSQYVYDYDESSVFQDVEKLNNPFYAVFDIPDNTTSIKFWIVVYDSDLFGTQMMDYNPSASVNFYVEHTVNAPFNQSWTYDGSDDGISNELDCELNYNIKAVG